MQYRVVKLTVMEKSRTENKIFTKTCLLVVQNIRLQRNEKLLLNNEHHNPEKEKPGLIKLLLFLFCNLMA